MRKAHFVGVRNLRTRVWVLMHRHEWLPKRFEGELMFFTDAELDHLRNMSYIVSVKEVAA